MTNDPTAMRAEADQLWIEVGAARVTLHYALDHAARAGLALPAALADSLAAANKHLAEWNAAVAAAEELEFAADLAAGAATDKGPE